MLLSVLDPFEPVNIKLCLDKLVALAMTTVKFMLYIMQEHHETANIN